jgi:WD40 repeat protein
LCVQKGSIPVSHIVAHDAKIYGIDWSHTNRNELVTCSLGKTIKTWDISSLYTSSIDSNTNTSPTFLNQKPKSIIKTTYPVWRALNLPFGHGILSLPQRGETVLEMYAAKNVDEYDDGDEEEVEVGRQAPVEVFEGHTDVVKEFVWRKGGPGMSFSAK